MSRLLQIKMINLLLALVLFSFECHATVDEEVIYAQTGEDVSLNLSYEFNKYYFSWFFGDKEIAIVNSYGKLHINNAEWSSRLILKTSSLVIKNITQADFGTFSCVVKKQLLEIDKRNFKLIQLNVAVDSDVLLPGEPLSLTCDVGSRDKPQIHWVSPRGQREGSGGRVTVKAASVHSGVWTCVVTDSARREKRKVTVKVTVIDLLPPAPVPTQYTSALNPLSLPCSLAQGVTWDQVKSKGVREIGWNFCPVEQQCDKSTPPLLLLSLEGDTPAWKKHPDKALQPSRNLGTGDLSLGRKPTREDDAGDYECFVKFRDGVTLNRTVRVEVLRIIATPGTQLRTGQQLNLTCTTGQPLPPGLHITWIPPGEVSSTPPPPNNPSMQNLGSAHLNIERVGSDHNGTWRCELRRGETTLTSAVVVLNIEQEFSVWMLVTLCAAAAILILLVVLIIILQRRRKRRTRRHVRLCHCKNPKPKGFYRS